MTLIHGSSVVPRGRPEDSTALQKRLLQDLERQWLDTWGRADQAQAQAASPDEKAAAANEPALSAERAAGVQAESPSIRTKSTSVAVSAERRGLANPAQMEGGGGSEMSGVHAASASRAGDRHLASSEAGMSAMTTDAHRPSDGWTQHVQVRPGEQKSQDAASDTAIAGSGMPQMNTLRHSPQNDHGEAGRALRGPGAACAMPAGNAAEQEASTGVAATSTTTISTATRPGSMPAFAAPTLLPSTEADHGDMEAGKAAPQRMSTTSPDQKPAPRHLMLREVGAQEVLASMRDAQLGSHESQLAAQGLARALMQAGYARVQVVVNGHRELQDVSKGPEDTATVAARRLEAAASETPNSQSARHGNQH
ncbi:hypothetical protein J2X20_000841 [Pelomonas saccharophila]|uniref:Uncharacterized protein n=1 Tax=Roseateles saccharophilus TaxID=304 RepID=A0ABU1YH73_ROSSA|nr:hypothetical protein [Roseateles saccharophilus]MDR7268212.1 hypothetical protein [Roseateles saccharophilus]